MIGAGWIGSEVAASARQMGAEVVLIDPAPAPLHRVLGDQIGEVFRRLHADHGVAAAAAHRGRRAARRRQRRAGRAERRRRRSRRCRRHRRRGHPRVELAVARRLQGRQRHRRRRAAAVQRTRRVRRGRRRLRLAPPLRPPPARRALGQRPQPGPHRRAPTPPAAPSAYTRLPYFFSDQYDLGMEYVGYSEPGDDGRGPRQPRRPRVHRLLAPRWHRHRSDERQRVGRRRGPQGDRGRGRALEPSRLADPAVALAELA